MPLLASTSFRWRRLRESGTWLPARAQLSAFLGNASARLGPCFSFVEPPSSRVFVCHFPDIANYLEDAAPGVVDIFFFFFVHYSRLIVALGRV